MNPPEKFRISIEGQERTFQWGGFTSEVSHHKHLMKHVMRINQADLDEIQDPEEWHKLWPKGQDLNKDLPARRKQAKKKLRACVPRCALASKAPASYDVCHECKDMEKYRAVSNAFRQDLNTYENLIAEAIRRSLQNTRWDKPAFFITGSEDEMELTCLSEDHLFAVASLAYEKLKIITGYRKTKKKKISSYRDALHQFNMKRRAAKNAKRLLAAQPVFD